MFCVLYVCVNILLFYFIGVILVNKIIQASSVQFQGTSSCVCYPISKFSSVTIYLTSFILHYLPTPFHLVTTTLLSVSRSFVNKTIFILSVLVGLYLYSERMLQCQYHKQINQVHGKQESLLNRDSRTYAHIQRFILSSLHRRAFKVLRQLPQIVTDISAQTL